MSFDTFVDRKNTDSVKWDLNEMFFGTEDVLPLWVADMDFKAPQPIIDAMTERVQHGVFGYTFMGDDYYNSIINWYKNRHNTQIKKEWILHCSGIVPALYFAVRAYTRKGDGVIVQQPVYYPFMESVENCGRKVLINELVLENGKYNIDFDDLEKHMKYGAKMLIISSPHNPVGRVWTEEELTKIINLCKKYNVIFISDEIHSDIIYKPHKHIPAIELYDKTILMNAPSKTFNIAGLKSAYIIIKDEVLREKFADIILQSYGIHNSIFGITATKAAYNHCVGWLDDLLEYLTGNIDFVREYLKENMLEVKLIEPESTYMLWLDFRAVNISNDELGKHLVDNAKVALHEGKKFGRNGKGFMRLNIGTQRETLKKALDMIKDVIK